MQDDAACSMGQLVSRGVAVKAVGISIEIDLADQDQGPKQCLAFI